MITPQVLIRHAVSYTLGCVHETKIFPTGCTYCIVTVPCGCSLYTPLDLIPARLSNCQLPTTGLVSSEPQYPVNLAVLKHFFDNDTLSAFTSNMLLSQPLGVRLPTMKFFNHSFDDKLATSHELSYQLEKVVNASKADEQIFRSMADPLLTGDLAVPSDFFLTRPGFLTVATAVVTSLNLLLFLWLAYRQRLTSAALAAVVSHVPNTMAGSIPTLLCAFLYYYTFSSCL